MKPDYDASFYPDTPHLDWTRFGRYMVMGPILGVMAGLAQFMPSVLIVIMEGDINAAFRGVDGVVITFIMLVALGAFQGSWSGVVLLFFERFSKRRVRPVLVMPFVMLPVFVLTWWEQSEVAVRDRGSAMMLVVILVAPFLFGVLVPILTSANPLDES